ncbi:hypothetical protein [Dysgonomonas sp. GY617]|uniref:hypothetical protein n=1 Tax=Dysgonomonas sp. GY617 TaxID=2780420 RepID=UPI001883B0B4|nr:hypothetical protein [Dysgonomonas sp. GY617]MBF0577705.1 hypothetical protein [Dysgonomonas sp. GY617]
MANDLLHIWKERIQKESKHGDKKKAYQKASVSETTYDNAMKRETIDDLTDSEFEVLSQHIVVLDERKQKRENRIKQHTNG